MHKDKNGFGHIVIFVLIFGVIAAVGLAAFYVIKNKTTILDGGYKWSTMEKGPYNDRVMYATSTDPLSWTGQGTLLAEHASVPDVLVRDGKLYVYFVDVSVDGKPEQIGIKTSDDNGKTWSSTAFAVFEGIGDKVPVDPAPYLLEDGRVRLYYYDIGKAGSSKTKTHTIYSAISSDGVHFTQEEGERFHYDDIYDPDVIQHADGWRLYVGTGDQKVLSATSKDGLSFTYEGVAYEGGAIPNVIKEGDTYILYTGGIQMATSSDGRTFTKSSSMFNAGGVTADPGVIKLSDNFYFMAFKTSSKTAVDQPAPTQQTTTPPNANPNGIAPQNQSNTPAQNGQPLDPVDPNLPHQAPTN